MDPTTRANRRAWETASEKHVREYDELLAEAAAGASLLDVERETLAGVLRRSPAVVHPAERQRHGRRRAGGRRRAVRGGRRLQRGGGRRGATARGPARRRLPVRRRGAARCAAGGRLEVVHLGEYPEPFWRMGGVTAAAWNGRLPNAFSLLARRR